MSLSIESSIEESEFSIQLREFFKKLIGKPYFIRQKQIANEIQISEASLSTFINRKKYCRKLILVSKEYIISNDELFSLECSYLRDYIKKSDINIKNEEKTNDFTTINPIVKNESNTIIKNFKIEEYEELDTIVEDICKLNSIDSKTIVTKDILYKKLYKILKKRFKE